MTTYFSDASFKFLRGLARHNERAWFLAHKAEYEATVREPFQRLLADLQPALAAISGQFRSEPKVVGGSLFRIQRDTRFSGDKAPYKSWQGARLFHARSRQVEAPSFYIHLQPGGCFVGGGLWHPEPDALKKIRAFLADNPAAWKKATQGKAFREHLQFWGESLKRPPHGFDPNHELIEDLKRKDFACGEGFDEAFACSAELLPWTVACFKRVAPMIDYLCATQELEF